MKRAARARAGEASDDGGAPRALEARWYTDAEVFERERRAVFARTWQFACHASRLARAGDFVAFAIARARLFVLRDREGRIRCFHNVCRHRAHELVEGAGSRPFVVCPYHGWRYDLDGALKSAPGEARARGFVREGVRLAEARAEVFCGFVFVNLDTQAAPMAAWYPGAEEELRAFLPEIDRLAPAAEFTVEEACNWKVSVENYNECYHCALRHPTFSAGVIDPASYDIRAQGHCLRHGAAAADAGRMTYAANDRAGGGLAYGAWFLWPAFSFQVYPGGVLNTYCWRARDRGRVTVARGWHTPGGESCERIEKLARQDLDTTVAEDVAIVESVQRGLESGAYEPGPLVIDPQGGVMSEHSIAALKGWLLDALDAAP